MFAIQIKIQIKANTLWKQASRASVLDEGRPAGPSLRAMDDPSRPRQLGVLGRPVVVAAVLIAALGVAGALIAINERSRNVALQSVVSRQLGTKVGAPFELIDHTGRTVTDRSFAGRKMLIMFGSLAERERLSAALQVLNEARELAGQPARDISFVLVTTDPENDTPPRLAAHLQQLGGSWTALTGPPGAILALARAYYVPISGNSATRKGAPPAAGVTTLYLMDEHGKFVSHRTLTPDPLAVALWLKQSP